MTENSTIAANFVQNIIDEDLKNGKYSEGIHTRFPPEPNGYLHIGHAKSMAYVIFGLTIRIQRRKMWNMWIRFKKMSSGLVLTGMIGCSILLVILRRCLN